MTLLLIRHGVTRLGEEGRYQGALDGGLTEAGRAALRAADFRPARVYVSPLLRARETAEILFPGSGQIVIPDLREMNFGDFEGRGWWEMEEDAAYRGWVDGGCRGRCPNGEDRAEFTARVLRAFDGILRSDAASPRQEQTGAPHESPEPTVVVAHGGTMMALLGERGEPRREYWQWQRPCGCGWLLETERGGDRLRVREELSFLR